MADRNHTKPSSSANDTTTPCLRALIIAGISVMIVPDDFFQETQDAKGLLIVKASCAPFALRQAAEAVSQM